MERGSGTQRREITAEVVQQVDRLLAEGVDHATISARLGITEYVVGVIAGDAHGHEEGEGGDHSRPHVAPRQNAVDAATVRMIQRMLAVGWLNHIQIAREAGVSPNFVSQVATGKRLVMATTRPPLDHGERFLPKTIRCSGCRRRILVVPCRICRALRQKNSEKVSSRM